MKKEEIRKEFFKLRIKEHSYSQCKKLLKSLFDFETSARTLKRWEKKHKTVEWDLRDESTKPRIIHRKITSEIESEVIKIRRETGWGEHKICEFVSEISHASVYRVLRKNRLTNSNPNRKKRIKYIRWQRKHPNSLWQMDTSDQKIKDKYCFAVIDDCSRYCVGLFDLNEVTTDIITHLLDGLIKVHGKPREILSDNGSVFGLRSKHSKFDRWCNRRGINHIRTAVHSPTTSGKIERFFQTLDKEFAFCNKNAELFRMRYNHFRPHTSLEKKCPAEVYFDFSKLI
ncbi:MAG: DDE-type integrase/transposase/recombinase [Nanoarchaeota archaeon]|nr:DDE-type integrase/transposase/recombinase [Nanoarchaeota archaeon]